MQEIEKLSAQQEGNYEADRRCEDQLWRKPPPTRRREIKVGSMEEKRLSAAQMKSVNDHC